MERKISFSIDNFYHIFNRGVEKRKIFLSDVDYNRFLRLLFFCNGDTPIVVKELLRGGFFQGPSLGEFERGKQLVDIGAYCLMPNHFHLLLKERTENGITNFLRKLCTAYSMYFNKKNERVGSLFQGRFGAQHLDRDVYLKYIFAYIHLNPVKLIDPFWKEEKYFKNQKKIKSAEVFLNDYPFSSFKFFIQGEHLYHILNTKAFPNYFDKKMEFKYFIKDWLNFAKVRPWENL